MTPDGRRKLAVVAIGGNSLIADKAHQSVPDQYAAAAETCVHIAEMIQAGWQVVVTHGNGPQVASSCAARSYPATSCTKSRWTPVAQTPRALSATCCNNACIMSSCGVACPTRRSPS